MPTPVWDPKRKHWIDPAEPWKPVSLKQRSYAQATRAKLNYRKKHRVFERDRWTCQQCGTISEELTIDHITPLSKGGTNAIDNLQVLCRPCNEKKADAPLPHTRGQHDEAIG